VSGWDSARGHAGSIPGPRSTVLPSQDPHRDVILSVAAAGMLPLQRNLAATEGPVRGGATQPADRARPHRPHALEARPQAMSWPRLQVLRPPPD